MSICHEDLTLCRVYITIRNLDVKTCQSQKWPRTLLLSAIPIIHKWSKDANDKDR